jgi:phospholipid/cholesterol/gamma-HCH transport system ATP-binding protein
VNPPNAERSAPSPDRSISSPPVVELRRVSLAFEDKPVLDDVSFRVGAGETLVLLGVTGSGQSVLLKVILGLLKPDAGQVLIEGQDLVPLSEARLYPFRQRMGIVFQEGALFDSLSVRENVAYRLREEGSKDEARIEEQVREVLRFVEMEQAIEKMPAELSGGMRRRVSIARAIVSQPSIMLYDSPTAGLDPVTAQTINLLIAKLRDVQKVSSLVVTHRLADAFALAHYTYSAEKQALIPARTDGGPGQRVPTQFLVLRDGATYFWGSTDELTAAQDPYLRKFLV